jgi:hypothetical protein
MGATLEEFVAFSVLYYLADLDSGRIARQIARSPYPRRFDRVAADRNSDAVPVNDPCERSSHAETSPPEPHPDLSARP